MKVYIAGPYTKGDVAENVRRAVDAGMLLADYGFCPYMPHLTHFCHLISPRSWDYWMRIDMEWLKECDYLVRLPGESSGADMEVREAQKLGIPVYYGLDKFLAINVKEAS